MMGGLKDTNLIFKEVNGEIKIIGVMDNTDLAKKYIIDLNNSEFSVDGVFKCKSVPVLNNGIPFSLIEDTMSEKRKVVKKFAEVVGNSVLSEIKVLNISEYTIEPTDFIDSDGLFHVFYDVTNEDLNSLSLNVNLINHFYSVVSEYLEGIECDCGCNENYKKVEDEDTMYEESLESFLRVLGVIQ